MKATTKFFSVSVFLKITTSILTVVLSLGYTYSQVCVNCTGPNMTGSFPSRVGGYTEVYGDYSFSGGYYSVVNGPLSFAFGNRVSVDGAHSVGMGMFVGTVGTSAMVFGSGFNLGNPLINRIDDSFMIGFGSTKPTLFVGRSIGVNNTGKIGIGNVTDPQAKLHIRADDGMIAEDATLMLEATGSGKSTKILMHGSQGYIGTTSERYSLTFFTGEKYERMTIDGESGNLGVGIASPTSRLHVAGDAHVSGDLIINSTTAISSGRIGRFANGTASAPAYSFSGNQNTGMFQPATGILAFSTGATERVRIASNGDVGIGTTSPGSALHVRRAVSGGYSYVHRIEVTGTASNVNNTKALEIRANSLSDAFLVYGDGRIITKGEFLHFDRTGNSSIRANDALSFRTNNVERIWITQDGQVGIGTTNPQGKLDVHGNALIRGDLYTEEVIVEDVLYWPDYVFNNDYELMGLGELKDFVKENRHLPGMPKADENGSVKNLKLSELNIQLLKKIEELTLYMLEQEERIQSLERLLE